jgi:hypothetical protein
MKLDLFAGNMSIICHYYLPQCEGRGPQESRNFFSDYFLDHNVMHCGVEKIYDITQLYELVS